MSQTDSLSPATQPWHLSVVDDDRAVLRSLARMLTACGYEVTAFLSAEEFLLGLSTRQPDALLVDLRMPGADGMALLDMLRERGYRIPAVFLSGHADVPTSVRAIRAGAVDFLEKPCDEPTLLASLARAFDVARRNRDAAGEATLEVKWRSLTPRERQVLRHVVQGQLNKQIAAALGTVEKTIKVHRARGMAKMGAKSLADLVRMVDRLGEGESRADLAAPRSSRRAVPRESPLGLSPA